jgi:hypothetical protein
MKENVKPTIIIGIVTLVAFAIGFGLAHVAEIDNPTGSDRPSVSTSPSAPILEGLKDGDATPCNHLAGLPAYSYTHEGSVVDVPDGMALYLELWEEDQAGELDVNIQNACIYRIQEYNTHN